MSDTMALQERRKRALGAQAPLFYDQPLHLVKGEDVCVYDENGRKYLDAYNNVPHVGHCHPRVVEAICRQASLLNLHTRYPAGERLRPDMRVIRVPDPYRNTDTEGEATLIESALVQVREAIDSLTQAGHGVAALLIDSLFSTEGVISAPQRFVQTAVGMIRAAGGLLVADEVQAGLGRTGERMWGYQRHELRADIVTLGKRMGNGHPLAGVITRPDYADQFASGAVYFNTFAGNPVSCAAGLAVLDVIESQSLLSNATEVGDYLRDGLRKLARRHDLIGDVRGSGLFIGVELVRDGMSKEPAPEAARHVVNRMKDRGVLMSRIGRYDNVLKIRSPMTFSRDHAALTAMQLHTLREAENVALQRLGTYGKRADRYGLIHADLVPENVLRAGDRLTVIDFDDAGFGWYVWELVTAVFFLQETPAYEPALRAMIAGYRQRRTVTDADLAILPDLMLLRGLVYLGWFQTRRETQTAREMTFPVAEMTVRLATRLLQESESGRVVDR